MSARIPEIIIIFAIAFYRRKPEGLSGVGVTFME